jgi:acetyl esterase/lipase
MPSDVLTRAAPPPDLLVRYGPGDEQVADVWLPSSGLQSEGTGSSGVPSGGAASSALPSAGPAPSAVPTARAGSGSRPLVVFLHGGFWRAEYDRTHTRTLARALANGGFVVCVPEFRRNGQPGGGWPGTFDDVAAAVDELPALVGDALEGLAGPGAVKVVRPWDITAPEPGCVGSAGPGSVGSAGPGAVGMSGAGAVGMSRAEAVSGAGEPGVINVGEVVLAGHSAGGQLALWAAGRHRLPASARWRRLPGQPAGAGGRGGSPVRIRGVVGLAAVTDLTACYEQGLGRDAAAGLMGGGPQDVPERYGLADPVRLLPLGCEVRLVHGTLDDRVPCTMSRAYVEVARAAGDDVALDELPAADHFDLIDPLSHAWPHVLHAFRRAIA